MPDDDREQRFEQAMARHLPNASSDSACPDAEILAAYHDRTLSAEEMSHWKQHIAACNRCQETLALVEQTENVTASDSEREKNLHSELLSAPSIFRAAAPVHHSPAAVIAAEIRDEVGNLRRRPPWRLLVSVGAIAATVIVWIGAREVRIQHRQQEYAAQVANNRLSMPQLQPPQSIPLARKQETPLAKAEEQAAPEKRTALSPKPSQQRESTLTASATPPDATAGGNLAITNDKKTKPNAKPGIVASRSADVSGFAEKAPTPETPATSQNQVTQLTPSGTGGGRSVEAKEQTGAAIRSSAQNVQVQAAAPPNLADAQMEVSALRVTPTLLELAAANPRYVVAPGETDAWLLGNAGQIQHTGNRGKTWKLQSSGVTADLTAGSATSGKICWVVGKAGTLLLTTDGGKNWKVLSSPIPGDLGGIHATDALHASIWDVTNRRSFQTSDGGKTWQPAANE
jgi:hypothetical protein